MENRKKNSIAWIVFGLGVTISILLRLRFPNLYHHFDVETFKEWIPFVSDLKSVYSTSCYCNYPALGLLLSSGVMSWLGNSIYAFLIFLSLIDAINVVLVFLILRKLKINQAVLWAGIIGLLPSTYVGGALWGQIDTIGQMELYFFLLLLIGQLQTPDQQLSRYKAAGMGALLSVALLTKQLLLFPVLILGFMTLQIWLGRKTKSIAATGMALISFILPILLIDKWLTLPGEYNLSHFQKIFLEGSEHVNFISGNGFNIWMLFVDEMYTPSTSSWFLGLSPKLMGILMVGITALFTFYAFAKYYLKQGVKQLIGNYLLGYALLFLAVNLFFTGTHERYLYHFYPFLLIALLLLRASKALLYYTLFGAVCYGSFVFGILKQYHHSQWLFSSYFAHRFVFVIHFVLFILLANNYLNPLFHGKKRST